MHALLISLSLLLTTATPPRRLHEQGRLLTSSGAPVTGSLPVVFSLYSQPTGGSPGWTETLSVSFDDGYFDVELGATSAFSANIFDGSVRYLGIRVGSDPEMAPRQVTDSVPYALLCENVTGDITPSGVSIGATRVIDSSGNWVGPPTGLVGPRGPSGVLSMQALSGGISPGGSTIQVSVNVTTTATEHVTVTAAVTANVSGSLYTFQHYVCYRQAGSTGTPTQVGPNQNVYSNSTASYAAATAAHTFVPGAGMWQVGWCLGPSTGVNGGVVGGFVMVTE